MLYLGVLPLGGSIMDIDKYVRKSGVRGRAVNLPKCCRTCGKPLSEEYKDYLFYQRFCSDLCREKYIYGDE